MKFHFKFIIASVVSLVTLSLTYLAIDILIRHWEPFELYNGWEHQQVDIKQTTYKKYVNKYKHVDVLIFGSSITMNLSAKRIAVKSKKYVFNGGIGGLVPETASTIFQFAYMPIKKPKTIIYGISPRALKDPKHIKRGVKAPLKSFNVRVETASTLTEKAEIFFEKYSYIFRIRRNFRDYIIRGGTPKTTTIKIGEFGSRRSFGRGGLHNLLNKKGEFPKNYYYRSRYSNYQINIAHGETAELIGFINDMESKGIDVILIDFPIAPACNLLFDNPIKNLEAYREAINHIISESKVRYFNAGNDLQLGNEHFANPDHLGMSGDRKVEDYIIDILSS